MKSKLLELNLNASITEYDIIVLTETWLDSSILNSEVLPANYRIFRTDRDFHSTGLSKGGGVLIAVDDSFSCTQIKSPANIPSLVDMLCLKLNLNPGRYVLLFAFYVPPQLSNGEYEELIDIICGMDSLNSDKNESIVMAGC